jgi:hypothetical protein
MPLKTIWSCRLSYNIAVVAVLRLHNFSPPGGGLSGDPEEPAPDNHSQDQQLHFIINHPTEGWLRRSARLLMASTTADVGQQVGGLIDSPSLVEASLKA